MDDVPESAVAAGPVFDDEFRHALLELFRWRRDVRRFRPDAVPDDVVDGLLDIAALAPSVGLSQPWRFVTVADPARRAAVRENFAAANHAALSCQDSHRAGLYARLKLAGLDEAPCHLAVFAEPAPEQGHGLGRMSMPETTTYSTVMAIHTLWLAARAAGLGLGWVSILDPAAISAALEVPSAWIFVGYFCLGVPEADGDTPELEREGWERRGDPAATRLRR